MGCMRGRRAGCCRADAIYDQYLPKSMEDAVPRTVEGALLAIADKADTIAGMFGLGLEPTGSKDPFALRTGGEWDCEDFGGVGGAADDAG